MVELNGKRESVDAFQEIESAYQDLRDMLELLDEDEFMASQKELTEELETVERKLAALAKKALLSGEYDANDCYFSIHAGSGGTEAMDWAGMLQRMYERWFQTKDWKVSLTDINTEETGGIKSVQFEVKGYNAYGYCKGEKGVHRLVRISPFDSQSRRHTSFASVDVYPVLKDIGEIQIDEKDIKVDTYRSTGAGGQQGSQIRSYVFQPYTLVKDHRTGEETGNIEKVMNGDLDPFVDAYLNWHAQQEAKGE